ncbi:MAG: hypothetical protein A2W31_14645 [Planctomycetes bacterium RBG_16_64_10]|nr:MAG: hypothetical protein A2W31_14645 [Planctomycetes bacterium RBG_16_64_10]
MTRFVRFAVGTTVSYGVVEGDCVRQITGSPFAAWQPTDVTHKLVEVKLLVPTEPSKVLALAGNYRSHLGSKPVPEHPELFLKTPSCLIADGESIVLPADTRPVEAEAELVIVIGKRARHVPVATAQDYVLGITCGCDVSAREWQRGDIQWARAKATDTFGPCGPFLVTGVPADDLRLQLRVNGQVQQDQRTADLIHGVAEIVSWASRYMTLEPGDLIYTGTPGTTPALQPGDTVEVELERVGILTNRVVAEGSR